MKGMVMSKAAPDDDPMAQCLGVCETDKAGTVYYGEMGEGQIHGLGRVDSVAATYVGFWERGMYQGPGLLLDHEERTRQEGAFRDGVLAEGSSTWATIDRQGRRGRDGRELEGEGFKVARDTAYQRLRVLIGTFQADQPEGKGGMWILGPAPDAGLGDKAGDERSGMVLEQRFEGIFKNRGPSYGRTYFQDGRAYIGGFDGYKGRKGLGFTVTKVGKGLIEDREGSQQKGGELIIDFAQRTFRKTSAAGGEEPEVSMDMDPARMGQSGWGTGSLGMWRNMTARRRTRRELNGWVDMN